MYSDTQLIVTHIQNVFSVRYGMNLYHADQFWSSALLEHIVLPPSVLFPRCSILVFMYAHQNDKLGEGWETFKQSETVSNIGTEFDSKVKSSPVTGLEWLRGFQEVKVPIFHENGTGWW